MTKLVSHTISVITHPLLMVTLGLLLCLRLDPYSFGVFDWTLKWPLIITIVMMTFFFPALVVFLLKRLGFIKSLNMETTKERIIPYIATSIFYLWLYITTKSNPEISALFKAYMLGTIITLFTVFFINNFYKISAHMAGMGGLIMLTILMSYRIEANDALGILSSRMPNLPSFFIILGGLTAGSRLTLLAHKWHELLAGFLVGLIGVAIALKIYLLF